MKQSVFLRALCLVLAVGCLLGCFVSCGDGYYSPIKSSRKNRAVLATMEEHEVKYELVRFLFMNMLDEVDGGDRSLWDGDGADALWDTAMTQVFREISTIYATFDVCRKWGIDPEGDRIDEMVNAYIKADIDGTYLGGTFVEGYGSVDAYKEALAATHSTDAVRRLLYRYSSCLTALYSFLAENRAQGELTVTEEQLTAFLTGGDCAHFNRVFIPITSRPGSTWEQKKADALAAAEKIHGDMLANLGDYDALIRVAFSKSYSSTTTIADGEQIENGIWLGKAAADTSYSQALYNAIFETAPGAVSDVIETPDGYYIIYGMSLTAEPLEDERLTELVTLSYIEQLYYSEIEAQAGVLLEGVTYKDKFTTLTAKQLLEGN